MPKPTKDDYLEFYGGLTEYACYLKEAFKEKKSLGIGLGIGPSLELLENLILIEKQLKLLDSDKSEKLNAATYKALLDAKEANYLLKEYFPFSTFSPYVEIFLKVTGEMQKSGLLEVLKALQLALGQEENKKNMVRSRKNDREKQVQLSRYIKSLFIASPSLLVVDLDVSYADEWDYNQSLKMLPESTDQEVQKDEGFEEIYSYWGISRLAYSYAPIDNEALSQDRLAVTFLDGKVTQWGDKFDPTVMSNQTLKTIQKTSQQYQQMYEKQIQNNKENK